MIYFNAWQVAVTAIQERLQRHIDNGDLSLTDIVWSGPSGDYVIGDAVEIEEDYGDYVDAGTVEDYLAE